MKTVHDLRAALDDADTPAGIDLTAVRRRAGRQRRSAFAAAGVAAVVAAAVAVPAAVTGQFLAGPATRAAAESCPNDFPRPLGNSGPGLAERLVPFTVDAALVCEYHVDSTDLTYSVLTTSRQLTPQTARALVAELEISRRRPDACTLEFRPSIVLRATGSGRTVLLLFNPAGCASVTNGVRTVMLGYDKAGVLDLLETARPLLTCPARADGQRPVPVGPTNRLVPFTPVRLVICSYPDPFPPGSYGKPERHEIGGPQAADYLRRLDAQPTTKPRCLTTPGNHHRYLIKVLGPAGQAATLTGDDFDCVSTSNGRRTVYGPGPRVETYPTASATSPGR
jgi:hypothetical protein